MTPRSRTRLALLLGTLLGLSLFAALGYAQGQARWHRYEQSKLDTYTTVDVVKDVYSQRCYAVYVVISSAMVATKSMAATPLGEVPCLPTK